MKKEIAERWSQNVRKSIVKSQRQRKSPRSENHEVVSTLESAIVCTDFAGGVEKMGSGKWKMDSMISTFFLLIGEKNVCFVPWKVEF